MKIMGVFVALVQLAHCHKILMAGSLERNEHKYFEQVARRAVKEGNNHTIYMLDHGVDFALPLEIREKEPSIFTI